MTALYKKRTFKGLFNEVQDIQTLCEIIRYMNSQKYEATDLLHVPCL